MPGLLMFLPWPIHAAEMVLSATFAIERLIEIRSFMYHETLTLDNHLNFQTQTLSKPTMAPKASRVEQCAARYAYLQCIYWASINLQQHDRRYIACHVRYQDL